MSQHHEVLRDESPSLFSPNTVAEVIMAAFAVVMLLLWHFALVFTSSGLGLFDFHGTFHALLAGHPLRTGAHRAPSAALALTVWFVLIVLAGGGLFAGWYRWVSRPSRRRGVSKGMATADDMDRIGEGRARSLAAQTRPSLTSDEVAQAPLAEVGWVMGDDIASGKPLVATPEDNVIVKGPPGSRKTTTLLIPAALEAPGPLVVTSTKPDVLDVIYETRAAKGRVWVFDPLDLAAWPEPMTWNPVAGCQRTRVAESRGGAFADGLGQDHSVTNGAFFTDMATMLLTHCLHAAALGKKDMRTVLRWGLMVAEDRGAEPLAVIRGSDDPRASTLHAQMLESTVSGHGDTVSSTRMSFTRLVKALADEEVMRWVIPREGVAEFSAREFVTSNDTLVLLSDDQSPVKAGALTAMLANEVFEEAKRTAMASAEGRLDPPLRLAGDEITNIAPLRNLPLFASTSRGYGVQLIFGAQDDAQLVTKWGDEGADTLLTCCVFEAMLPGIKNYDTLERASRLVGSVDLVQMMGSFDEHSLLTSQSMHEKTREILRPDQIRRLEDGTALVLARNSPGVVVRLTPWYERSNGPKLKAAAQRTARLRAAHAEELRKAEEALNHG